MFFKALILSFVVHALFFVLFPSRKTSAPLRYVEVASTVSPRPSNPARKNLGGGKKRGLSLGDLGIGWHRADGVALPLGVADGDPSASAIGEGNGNAGGLTGFSRAPVFSRAVFEQIESALDYPREFFEVGIEGIAKARFRFTADGNFVPESLRVESSSRFLRVHVTRVLRSLFKDRGSKLYRNMKVSCVFDFALTDSPSLPVSDERSLTFHRAGRLPGAWTVGPVSGIGVAPTIGIDPEWFVSQAEKVVSNKAPIDPLQKYRDDPAW